jgi:quercetin dioxygenase-like cupin family protein
MTFPHGFTLTVLAAAMLTTGNAAVAQTSAIQKVLLENANATVVAATYPPGAILHTHGPARAVYVIQGPYNATWTTADGRTVSVHHETGEAYWFPGGNVVVKNTGSNTVRVLAVIEKK